MLGRAYEAAQTAAVSIHSGEAHGVLGQAILCRDFAWASAERQLLHAIELNPNYSAARVYYALQLAMEGRFTESLREAHVARDLDPLAIISRFAVAWCSYHARRYDEAYVLCRDTLEAEPQNLMMLYGSSFLLSQLGRHDEAIAAATRCIEFMVRRAIRSGALARRWQKRATRQRRSGADRNGRHCQIAVTSRLSSGVGSLCPGTDESALDLLEQHMRQRTPKCSGWVLTGARSMHGHPRFNALLRKLNHRWQRCRRCRPSPRRPGIHRSFAVQGPELARRKHR